MSDKTSREQEDNTDHQSLTEPSIQSIRALSTEINDLQQEIHRLKLKLRRYERRPTNTIAYLLVLTGACSLAFSIVWTSQILAFIGLGLTFWGALLLYARPARYMHSELIDSTAISAIRALNQAIDNLGYEGKPIYLPPTTLREIKDSRMLLPARKETTHPSALPVTGTPTTENPKRILLAPPGLGLANLFEEKLGVRFVEVDLDYLQTNLPRLLIEDLEIVEDLELQQQGDTIQIKAKGSAYASLCSGTRKETKHPGRVGCPLCSALGVILARTTHRPIVIEREEVSEDGKDTVTRYRMLPG